MVPPGFAADGTPLMSVIFTDAAGGASFYQKSYPVTNS